MSQAQRAPEVDAFMVALEHPLKPVIERLRTLVLGLVPGVTEKIKWKAPSFGLDGADQITFHLRSKAGIQLVLHRGVKVKSAATFAFADPAGLLAWPAKDRAVLTVRDLAHLTGSERAVTDVLTRWLTETRDPVS